MQSVTVISCCSRARLPNLPGQGRTRSPGIPGTPGIQVGTAHVPQPSCPLCPDVPCYLGAGMPAPVALSLPEGKSGWVPEEGLPRTQDARWSGQVGENQPPRPQDHQSSPWPLVRAGGPAGVLPRKAKWPRGIPSPFTPSDRPLRCQALAGTRGDVPAGVETQVE